MRWQSAGLTDTGLVRSTNQDALALDDQLGVYIVADGVGGAAGGGIASQLATRTVLASLRSMQQAVSSTLQSQPGATSPLIQAIMHGQAAICEQARREPGLAEMGTTIVALHVRSGSPGVATVAHVGDSRAYLVRKHSIRLLTRDHSLVEELVRQEQITPEEAETHPQRNILMRSLGLQYNPNPDVFTFTPEPSDIVLLCSDGLAKMVADKDILSRLTIASEAPAEACQQLVALANARGGRDNITVVVVAFS
jgi:protein phosphatase